MKLFGQMMDDDELPRYGIRWAKRNGWFKPSFCIFLCLGERTLALTYWGGDF